MRITYCFLSCHDAVSPDRAEPVCSPNIFTHLCCKILFSAHFLKVANYVDVFISFSLFLRNTASLFMETWDGFIYKLIGLLTRVTLFKTLFLTRKKKDLFLLISSDLAT